MPTLKKLKNGSPLQLESKNKIIRVKMILNRFPCQENNGTETPLRPMKLSSQSISSRKQSIPLVLLLGAHWKVRCQMESQREKQHSQQNTRAAQNGQTQLKHTFGMLKLLPMKRSDQNHY